MLEVKRVYKNLEKLNGQALVNYVKSKSPVSWCEQVIYKHTGARIQRSGYTIDGVYIFIDRSKQYGKETHIIARCPIHNKVFSKWIVE